MHILFKQYALPYYLIFNPSLSSSNIFERQNTKKKFLFCQEVITVNHSACSRNNVSALTSITSCSLHMPGSFTYDNWLSFNKEASLSFSFFLSIYISWETEKSQNFLQILFNAWNSCYFHLLLFLLPLFLPLLFLFRAGYQILSFDCTVKWFCGSTQWATTVT